MHVVHLGSRLRKVRHVEKPVEGVLMSRLLDLSPAGNTCQNSLSRAWEAGAFIHNSTLGVSLWHFGIASASGEFKRKPSSREMDTGA